MALILAVDDESSGLYFRKLILEHAGHTVLSSTGVEEALTLFRTNPVDIVVTTICWDARPETIWLPR